MTLSERFRSIAQEYADRRVSPETLAEGIEIKPGESVEWVAQTFSNGEMFNLFRLVSRGSKDAFMAVSFSDGGCLSGHLGPAGSAEEIMDGIGPAEEGWTWL